MKFISVIGGRAHLIKIAPIHHAATAYARIFHLLVDTELFKRPYGKTLFDELQLPLPSITIEFDIEFKTYISFVQALIDRLDQIIKEESPDVMLAYGDLNQSLAACIAAVRRNVPVAHVEAGLRSGDISDTEEFNRIVIDKCSQFLFAPSATARENLIAEGIPSDRVYVVGNTIIDCLRTHLPQAQESILGELGIGKKDYGLFILHRQENLQNKEVMQKILEGVYRIQKRIKVVFIRYAATRSALISSGLDTEVAAMPNILPLETLSYHSYIALLQHARFVLTDSSSAQDESTYLGIPCFTCRQRTHRTESEEFGTNTVVGIEPSSIEEKIGELLDGHGKYSSGIPVLWDGKAAVRIMEVLTKHIT